jgi:hypothetical protein
MSIIYLGDYIFSTISKNGIAESQIKLEQVDRKIRLNDYNGALLEIDKYQILDKKGFLQLNLQTRRAICLINQDNIPQAKIIFEKLIETYPFIRFFNDYYKLCEKRENYIEFANIIMDNSKKMNSIYDSKPTIGEIFSSMKPIHYIQFMNITGVCILLYERRRRNKNKSRTPNTV